MSKKKVAKQLGLTAAVAASAVVAANPASAASASTVETAVVQAEKDAIALGKFYRSTDLNVSADFSAAYNKAKKSIESAKAQVATLTGSQKSLLSARVAAADANRLKAAYYIDGVKFVQNDLAEATAALAEHVEAGEITDETVEVYNNLSATIRKAERVIGKIYGSEVRKAIESTYLLDAKFAREAVIYEVSQYELMNEIAEQVAAGQLTTAADNFKVLERLKVRAVEIKEAGRALYPNRTDVYPDLPSIETQLRTTETAVVSSYEAKLAPAVKSVSAINASQVVVSFNKAVDKTTAETEGYYTVDGKAPSKAELQEDGTVLLTLSSAYTKATTVAVEIDGVKLKDSQDTFPIYAGTVTISDKVNAEIKEVKGTTNGDTLKSVTVSYSEPVKAGAAIKINGVKVGVTEAGVSQTISSLSLDATKEHTVEIVNLTDGADNVNALATYKFTATTDKTAPTVKSVSALNDTQFVVEFSEKIDKDSVATGDFAVVKSADLTSVTVSKVEQQSGDTTGTKYVVTTNLDADDYKTVSSVGLNIAFADKAFKDVPGNESAASTASVTLSKDTVAPTLSAAVFEKDKDGEVTKVTLKFDEEVVLGSNMNHEDLEVVAENGVLKTDLFTKTEVDGKNVILTVKDDTKSGKFSIGLPTGFVVDKAIVANKSAATSTIVDFGKADASTTYDITKAENTLTANVFQVTFPKAVVGGAFDGSATSLDRYTLNGKALPTGTKITLDADQKVATITLPSDSVSTTDSAAVFQVSGVKALTGETNKFYTTTVKVTDNVSPELKSAQLLADGQTFVLTFGEEVTATTNLGEEFKIVADGKEVTLKDDEFTKVSSTGKQLVVKVDATVETAAAKPATAVKSGTNAAKVTLTNGDKASKDATYNFTIADGAVGGANEGKLVVTDGTTELAALDVNGDASFVLDGVTIAVVGGAKADAFTVTTTAPVAAQTGALKLDTTKVVSIETVGTVTNTLNFGVEDAEGNDQKGEVKVVTTR